MSLSPIINKDKLLHCLLYIASKGSLTDIVHMAKILYFAEKAHLQQFGRFICGSTFARLQYGPVPSEAYDLLKALANRHQSYFITTNLDLFEAARNVIGADISGRYPRYFAVGKPSMELFSRSDLRCLDEAITTIGPLSFEELKERSHDEVWKAAEDADQHFIHLETFVSALPNKEALLEYLAERG